MNYTFTTIPSTEYNIYNINENLRLESSVRDLSYPYSDKKSKDQEVTLPKDVCIENEYTDNHFSDLYRRVANVLVELRKLPENWDGFGAVKISSECLDNVEFFLSNINPSYMQTLSIDNICPNPYGTVDVEWKVGRFSVSIEIGDTRCSIYSELPNGQQSCFDRVEISDCPAPGCVDQLTS